jgi:flagellar biosynthesis anti-sigma factor FlgM
MSVDRVNISNQGIDRSQQLQGTEQVRNTGKDGKDAKVSKASDAVTLSSKAKDIERLSSSVEESRAEHLEKVRQALESGTYKVSSRDMARKLIDANTK